MWKRLHIGEIARSAKESIVSAPMQTQMKVPAVAGKRRGNAYHIIILYGAHRWLGDDFSKQANVVDAGMDTATATRVQVQVQTQEHWGWKR